MMPTLEQLTEDHPGIRELTLSFLEEQPVLSTGQTDDLRIEIESEGYILRVWLARTGVDDGEPFDNKVTLEVRANEGNSRWEVLEEYPAK